MSNMNVRARLERISADLSTVRTYIQTYHGVPKVDALFVDNVATDIAAEAADIVSMARTAQGNRSAKHLIAKVRAALGFTYPSR